MANGSGLSECGRSLMDDPLLFPLALVGVVIVHCWIAMVGDRTFLVHGQGVGDLPLDLDHAASFHGVALEGLRAEP